MKNVNELPDNEIQILKQLELICGEKLNQLLKIFNSKIDSLKNKSVKF